jgi:hypothetical protein
MIELQFGASRGKKGKNKTVPLSEIPVKGAQTKGVRLGARESEKSNFRPR